MDLTKSLIELQDFNVSNQLFSLVLELVHDGSV